jgi:protein-S-isoprenylcysteine O-methyltransferase Ste14
MKAPPVFVYLEAVFFWAVMMWAFIPEIYLCSLSAKVSSNPQDAGTFRLIDTASDIALLLAFALSFLPYPIIPFPQIALYTGTGLLIAGSLLRRYCFRTLGKYFTAAVIVNPGQPVIDRGPYRWTRHPGYTAAFIMFFGLGIALNNWLSLAVLFLVASYIYSRRVKAEEKALLDTIGEPYRVYMARTKRFIPFVF